MKKERKVAILSAKRTPLGAFGGVFKNYSAVDLGIAAVNSTIMDHKHPEAPNPLLEIKKVFFGNVIGAGLGQNISRQIALKLGINCPAVTVNKVCGSGMEAIILGAQSILSGETNLVLVGGTENMSMAPYLNYDQRWGKGFGNSEVVDAMVKDGLIDAFSGKLMLEIADLAVREYLSEILKNNNPEFLKQRLNNWAHLSYQRALAAIKEGKFANEIAEVVLKQGIIKDDEGPAKYRPDKLDLLKPVPPTLTITAGNASQISDGAAVLLLSSMEYAEKHHLAPLAVITGYDFLAEDPAIFPIIPTHLAEKYFIENNINQADVDLFEFNEAFTLVPVYAAAKLNIPVEKINIHGGAVALGHPLGTSGARIVVTLAHALRGYKKKKGIAIICIGGGEALLLSIEAI